MTRAALRLAATPDEWLAPSSQRSLGWVGLLLAAALLGVAGFDLGSAAAAAILFLAAAAPAVLDKDLRSDGRTAIALLAAVLAHVLVAVVNAGVTATLGADSDARGFHSEAVRLGQALDLDLGLASGTEVYLQMLAGVYAWFGPSLLLGSSLSILAFSLSAVVLARIIKHLGLPRRAGTLALFGLLPSGLMFLSVTLREAFQQLFFLVAVYAALRMRQRPVLWGVVLVASAWMLSLWHHGLPVGAGFVVLSAVAWAAPPGPGRQWWKRLAVVAIAGGLLVLIATQLGGRTAVIDALVTGRPFEYADDFRRLGATAEGRTTYGLRLDAGSVLGLVVTVPLVFGEYLLAPFPWEIGNLLDVYAFAENVLRIVLLVAALQAWRRARAPLRAQLGLLVWLFLGMELLWSLGTVNWGTAMRHHQPALGVLIVAGGPPLLAALGRRRSRQPSRAPAGRGQRA